jgi:hypothetical protein
MHSRMIAALTFSLVANHVHAGPFGVLVETFTPEAYNCIAQDKASNLFTCTSFPKPHPDIENYIASFINGIGLCEIFASSASLSTPGSGAPLKSKIDSISEQLSIKYGPSTKIDLLANGSLWTEEQYWMMGLLKGERNYAYLWVDMQPAVDGIVSVVLNSFAENTESGSFGISFYTTNQSDCETAKKARDASSF